MFKYLASLFSLSLLSFSFIAGAAQPTPSQEGPKLLNMQTPQAQMKLQRAEHILSSLVFDPQSYTVLISQDNSFGGVAVPPGEFSNKPTIIVFQGSLNPNRTNEEIAFMMAHELGHLNLYHNEQLMQEMNKVFSGPPIRVSETTFMPFRQKFEEQQADMFGLHLYANAGYTLNFFPETLKVVTKDPRIHFGTDHYVAVSSLSPKDTHFSIKERFQLLTNEAQKMTTYR